MDKAIVIALAALGMAIAAAMGAGVGFAYLAGDPSNQVAQQCRVVHCVNLKITGRTANHVDYTYDTPDGMHCVAYNQVTRRGLFGLPSGGGGGATCAAAGQPLPLPGKQPAPPTPFPDGNPPCSASPLTLRQLSGPFPTSTGIEIRLTNNTGAACDVAGPVDVQFLPANGAPLNVRVLQAAEPRSALAIPAGGTAAFAIDNGRSGCQGYARVIMIGPVGGPSLESSPGTVCVPVTAHQPHLLTQG